MKWNGVNRKTTPTDDDHSVSHYQENTRLKVAGELRRRNGMSRANIAKLATPIYGIASTVAPVPSICLQGSTGSIDGFTTFEPVWGDVQLLAPTGTATYGDAYLPADGISDSVDFDEIGSFWSVGYSYPPTLSAYLNINSGGINGNIYRVTFTWNFTVSDDTATSMFMAMSTLFQESTGYGWILSSNTNTGVSFIGLPTDNNYSPMSGYVPSGSQVSLITRYLTKGGASFGNTMSCGATWISSFPFPQPVNPRCVGTFSVVSEQYVAHGSSDVTVSVNRGSDQFVESFDIYGKVGSYPADPSDGTYFVNLPISPSETSASTTFTPGATGYLFTAVPRRGSLVGPQGLLT